MEGGAPNSALELFGAGTSLLAGYIFIRFSPYRRFASEHLRTDRFALHLLGWSLFFYILGTFAEALTGIFWPGSAVLKWIRVELSSRGIPPAVLYSIVLAAIGSNIDRYWILFRRRNSVAVTASSGQNLLKLSRTAAGAQYMLNCNDSMMRTLYRASFLGKQIMVTLRTGKVYVGEPVAHFADPATQPPDLRIVPAVSGYRRRLSRRIKFTTFYDKLPYEIDDDIPGDAEPYTSPLRSTPATLKLAGGATTSIDIEDIGVIVPWREIESLTIFESHLYRAFQQHGANDSPRPR